MKKKIIIVFLFLVGLLPLNVKALSIDKNNLTLAKGTNESIPIYANTESNVTEISFTLVYTTYDVPAYFKLEPGLTDTNPNGISHKIIFSNPVSGKIKLGTIDVSVVNNPKVTNGTINIHSGKALTVNGMINLNAQTINVTIGEPVQEIVTPIEKKTNLLKSIDSNIVKIKLQKDTYEYSVNIAKNVEELDLKATPNEESYQVEISNQKISELTDNTITIKVKDGDNVEEYKVKVNIKEDKPIKNNNKKDNNEKESSFKYKGKWITLIIVMTVVLLVGVVLTKKK